MELNSRKFTDKTLVCFFGYVGQLLACVWLQFQVCCAFLEKTCLPAVEGHTSSRAFWKNVTLEYMLLLLEFLGYAGAITLYIPSLPVFLLLSLSSHSFKDIWKSQMKQSSGTSFFFFPQHFLRRAVRIIMGFRQYSVKTGSMFLNMLKFGLIWHLSSLKRQGLTCLI